MDDYKPSSDPVIRKPQKIPDGNLGLPNVAKL